MVAELRRPVCYWGSGFAEPEVGSAVAAAVVAEVVGVAVVVVDGWEFAVVVADVGKRWTAGRSAAVADSLVVGSWDLRDVGTPGSGEGSPAEDVPAVVGVVRGTEEPGWGVLAEEDSTERSGGWRSDEPGMRRPVVLDSILEAC